MNVEIKPFNSLPCRPRVFTINGINANTDYFGHSEDTNRDIAEPYGCGCSEFVPNDDDMSAAMEMYGISADEFHEIQDMLVDKLSVGYCVCCI